MQRKSCLVLRGIDYNEMLRDEGAITLPFRTEGDRGEKAWCSLGVYRGKEKLWTSFLTSMPSLRNEMVLQGPSNGKEKREYQTDGAIQCFMARIWGFWSEARCSLSVTEALPVPRLAPPPRCATLAHMLKHIHSTRTRTTYTRTRYTIHST
jgi:hypothetical protein